MFCILYLQVDRERIRNIPLPTLPYKYKPLGAGGGVGRRPTAVSNFFSRLR